MQRAKLERDMPEESAEELERRLLEAEEQFQTVVRRGEAIARIRYLTEELLEQMDSGTYRGLEKDLEQSVAVMTDDRYNRIELDDGLPQGFICENGTLLPYEMLSTGTKDVLAIALRLSMANHFLKDADGFLIMDDPLVDLDPKRQEKASELLRRFAEHKQIVLFACHPSHVELLGGHQVTL